MTENIHRYSEYGILLRNYTHAFSPGVHLVGNSYCCDFGKSLLNTKTRILPDFAFDVVYSRILTRGIAQFSHGSVW